MKQDSTLMRLFNKFIKYSPSSEYNFTITTENSKDIDKTPVVTTKEIEPINFTNNLEENLNFLKYKYNQMINSDIVFREFIFKIQNKEYNAVLIYIDGMVDTKIINDSVLKPLMLHNEKDIVKEFNQNDVIIRKIKKFNLENYIVKKLIPQTDTKKVEKYEDAINSINAGNSVLLVDTLNVCFDIDAKGFKQRSINSPQNEIVIRGSQEAFIENLRTNTSMLRRIINNENLVIENCQVGKISKTNVAICYLSDIANNDLVAEVRYRVNNLDIDYLLSSGQLEQLIQDSGYSLFPQMLATERPDKTAIHLFEGRVAIIVNGSPYVLVAPGVLSDFLSSPEDSNYRFQFSNTLKFIRLFSVFFALFLPGIYVAITTHHQELLPTELLFTIEAARETVPFPIIFEILLMEGSFELIREARA